MTKPNTKLVVDGRNALTFYSSRQYLPRIKTKARNGESRLAAKICTILVPFKHPVGKHGGSVLLTLTFSLT
jgi:hypothetical protein